MTSSLTINVRNIVKNYQALIKHVGKQVKVASVVKCNCYGLGMERIAPALFEAGCREFYVAELGEGLACRALLKTADIHVLHGIEPGEEKEFLDAKLIPVLNNFQQIAIWTKAAKKSGERLKCSLHIDTGMTRIGIDSHLAEDAISSILKDDRLEICYVLSHLACACDEANKMNRVQLDFMKSLKKKYPGFKYSFSNSWGIFLGKEYHFDQVRPGIALYGGKPASKLPVDLLPVASLTSNIIDIHEIKSITIADAAFLSSSSPTRHPRERGDPGTNNSPQGSILNLMRKWYRALLVGDSKTKLTTFGGNHLFLDPRVREDDGAGGWSQESLEQQSIGYNGTYKLKPGMVTATISVGYGDGYPRRLGNVGYCYINGTKVNIIGNISMDLMSIDISNVPKSLQKLGQQVEVIGNNISIEKIARLADTVNYEILTALGGRYIREYIT